MDDKTFARYQPVW